LPVIPAQAGIQEPCGLSERGRYWIPACAGMTGQSAVSVHITRSRVFEIVPDSSAFQ
jgi:hypothetical protein